MTIQRNPNEESSIAIIVQADDTPQAQALRWDRMHRLGSVYRARPIAFFVSVVGLLLIAGNLLISLRGVLTNPYWPVASDFGVYVKAAQALADGRNLYDPALYHMFGSASGTSQVVNVSLYVYPPAFAEAILFLLAFGMWPARVLWWCICFGSTLGGLLLALRGFRYRMPWSWSLLLVGGVLSTHLVHNDLYHGEANELILLLLVLGLWCYAHSTVSEADRHRRLLLISSILCWGAAITVKPFLIVLVLYLVLFRRDWRAAFGTVVTVAGITALSLAVLADRSVTAVQGYLHTTAVFASPAVITQLDNESLRGLAVRAFTPNAYSKAWIASPILVLLASGIVLLALVIAVLRAAMARVPVFTDAASADAQLVTGFSFVIAAALAFGPLTEGGYVLWFLPACASVGYLALNARTRIWWITLAFWLALAIAYLGPSPSTTIAGSEMSAWSTSGVLLLWTARIGFLLLTVTLVTAEALRESPGRSPWWANSPA